MVKTTYKSLQLILSLLAATTTTAQWAVRLFTSISGNSFTPSTDLNSIVEASYSGYTAVSVSMNSSAFLSEDIPARETIDAKTIASFRPTDGTIPNTVLGYLIADSAASTANVLFGEVFDSGVVLSNNTKKLDILVRFGLDPVADYDEASISD